MFACAPFYGPEFDHNAQNASHEEGKNCATGKMRSSREMSLGSGAVRRRQNQAGRQERTQDNADEPGNQICQKDVAEPRIIGVGGKAFVAKAFRGNCQHASDWKEQR